jgi:predicted RNA-binding Zn-ribbon protein involved in translation (DUF1610 family)
MLTLVTSKLGGVYPSSAQNQGQVSSSDGKYPCPHCDKVKDTADKLRRHLRNHNKQYVCPYPGCTFEGGFRGAQKKDLYRHLHTWHKDLAVQTNIPSPDTTCPHCGRILKRDDSLPKHIERHHPDNYNEKKRGRQSVSRKSASKELPARRAGNAQHINIVDDNCELDPEESARSPRSTGLSSSPEVIIDDTTTARQSVLIS